jgi:hypothetical protein
VAENTPMEFTRRDGRHRKIGRDLTADEVSSLIGYLNNPTSQGIWKLSTKWLFGKGISADVFTQLDSNKPKPLTKVREQIKQDYLESVSKKIESITYTFKLLTILKDGEDEENITLDLDDPRYGYDNTNEYSSTLQNLDRKKLLEKYRDAVDYFKSEIYFDGMETDVSDGLFKIKKGSFIVERAPRDIRNDMEAGNTRGSLTAIVNENIVILANDKEPIFKLMKLYSLLGKINECPLIRVFSPEDELLSPYVKFMSAVLPYVFVSNAGVHRLFRKMINDFDTSNFEGTISAAGLVGEETLTQIYETLQRQTVPSNLPLGALRDCISEVVRNTKKDAQVRKTLNKNEIIKKVKEIMTDGNDSAKDIAKIVKILLEYTSNRDTEISERLMTLEGNNKDLSIFPPQTRKNLDGLIRFRNSVSHKSSEPLGSLEALKSMYYSFSLYGWWDNEITKIDWDGDKKDVVRQLSSSAA